MKRQIYAAMLVLGALSATSPALADDPEDPDMKNPAMRAADAAEIRRLNNEQAAYVRERDARYAAGWQAWREQPSREAEYDRRLAQYDRARDNYEARMEEWRRAVRLCRSGYYEYCR